MLPRPRLCTLLPGVMALPLAAVPQLITGRRPAPAAVTSCGLFAVNLGLLQLLAVMITHRVIQMTPLVRMPLLLGGLQLHTKGLAGFAPLHACRPPGDPVELAASRHTSSCPLSTPQV